MKRFHEITNTYMSIVFINPPFQTKDKYQNLVETIYSFFCNNWQLIKRQWRQSMHKSRRMTNYNTITTIQSPPWTNSGNNLTHPETCDRLHRKLYFISCKQHPFLFSCLPKILQVFLTHTIWVTRCDTQMSPQLECTQWTLSSHFWYQFDEFLEKVDLYHNLFLIFAGLGVYCFVTHQEVIVFPQKMTKNVLPRNNFVGNFWFHIHYQILFLRIFCFSKRKWWRLCWMLKGVKKRMWASNLNQFVY